MNEQLNDLSEYLIEPYRVINYDIATTLQHRRIVYHTRLTNVDGSPLRARVNGKIKVWKTRPGHFELPCKYGLKFGFKITHENCHEWVVEV